MASALAIAVAGLLLLAGQRGGEQSSTPTNATLGGLTAHVETARWTMADHVMPIPAEGDAAGYQMPPQMMPGMPTGDDVRLSVPLTLQNTSDEARRFDLAGEFLLRGGREAQPRTPASDTFGELDRLGPGSAVHGVLFFDAEAPAANDPPLYLEWARDEQTARIVVQLEGMVPPHHN